jgi:hypothetical protein
MSEQETKSLPENAYQPLKAGETYTPIIQAGMTAPEMTARAILWGVFSASSSPLLQPTQP